MRGINKILVLLLATVLVAGPALPPAANAVPAPSTSSGSQSASVVTVTGGTGAGDDTGRGDPGGAGDGLGADIVKSAASSGQPERVGVMVDLLLQLLRLMQAAG